jgi:hypothetical protein
MMILTKTTNPLLTSGIAPRTVPAKNQKTESPASANPAETFQASDPKEAALENLGGIARRGEFWDCGGVKEKHLGIIQDSLRPQEDVLEATDAFVKLFDVYDSKTAAPTTPTNRAWPKLAAMAQPGESMGTVVEAFSQLVGFESQRQLLDGVRHGMRSMENINDKLETGGDRLALVSEFKQDPDGFFGPKGEPTPDPEVFGHVNHRNVDSFRHYQVSSSQLLTVLEDPPQNLV